MLGDDVQVKCRNCGKTAKAKSYVLDPDLKMMVCPECARHKGTPKPEAQVKPQKPSDWDEDDEYLARAAKKPKKPQLEEGMKLKCKKCSYVFVYNGKRVCPYCDSSF